MRVAPLLQDFLLVCNARQWTSAKKFTMSGLLGGSRWQSIYFVVKNQAFCIFHQILRGNALLKGQFVPVQPITGLPSRELALKLMRDSDRSSVDTGTGETRTLNPIYLYVGREYGWGHA